MKRTLATLAACLAGCSSMTTDRAAPHSAPASLARAETSFAAQSVREGMRAAFLAWLAPEATIFRNGPVNGPRYIAAKPDPPIVLDWRPVYVEVAASGEMGLSTGPWTLTSRRDPAAPPSHGQFVSIWKRAPQGPWRVDIDLGISNPGADLAEAPLQAVTPPADPADATDAPGTLAAAEAAFAGRATAKGDAAAYSESASGTIRLYREGHAPFLGRERALASPVATGGRTTWIVERLEASASGDLGYAMGRYAAANGAAAGHFLRVWRREPSGWRIAADVTNESAQR
jgi:ketosteroid isomerase-like protein